ncbi:histidine kinase [uncultured Methylibium sp.]|uniref:sensor histidine kinase n=1 Tax=uncultured Methylibium sp. TaxID=381093 RepID=UPI0025D7A440|nr:histidine kinase [uncultured Methylibium sp.]
MAPTAPAVDDLKRTLILGVLMCLGVALVLTGLRGGRDLAANLVYSFAIGMSCLGLIEGGRRIAPDWAWRWQARHGHAAGRWPGWPWMSVVIVFGTTAGYTLGASIGNALSGKGLPMPWKFGSAASAVASLTISLTVACIATAFFWMRGRLASAQARAEAAQRLAADTQLKLLESQLEPHMLFNTLANLRALIALDPPRAQAMLDHLIAFLRSTLAASRASLHPLAAEFERSADYLALMQVRLGDRLASTLDLPPELAAQPVPPLLLQPLLENAIQHGIEPHRPGGRIALRAWRDGDRLHLSVHDTGIGLEAARASAGTGFGTTQVRERLATLYGDAASLTLASAPGGGTLATITLPLGA